LRHAGDRDLKEKRDYIKGGYKNWHYDGKNRNIMAIGGIIIAESIVCTVNIIRIIIQINGVILQNGIG
jgi:hypothetical protein